WSSDVCSSDLTASILSSVVTAAVKTLERMLAVPQPAAETMLLTERLKIERMIFRDIGRLEAWKMLNEARADDSETPVEPTKEIQEAEPAGAVRKFIGIEP